MHLTSSQIVPFLLAALVVWSIYRRLRRSFGKQRLLPVRMGIRIGIFLLIGCLLLVPFVHAAAYWAALSIGIVSGVAVALWGASQTRYLRDAGQLFYVPHTYTGLAVSLLFVGRMVYRFVQIYSMRPAGAPGAAPNFSAESMISSPLTFGLFYVLVGYYVCYYSVVLWKSKHLTAEELAAESAPVPQ
jgi:hypothetical protein